MTVSIKIPARVLDHIPPAGHGRSGFIVQAIEEKLEVDQLTSIPSTGEWKHYTATGSASSSKLYIYLTLRGEGVGLQRREHGG